MKRWFAAVTLPMPTAPSIDAAPARNARPPAALHEGPALDARSVLRRDAQEGRALVAGRGRERERTPAHPRNNASPPAAVSPEVLDRADAPGSEETLWYELVGRLFEYKQHRRHWRGERWHGHADVIDIP